MLDYIIERLVNLLFYYFVVGVKIVKLERERNKIDIYLYDMIISLFY